MGRKCWAQMTPIFTRGARVLTNGWTTCLHTWRYIYQLVTESTLNYTLPVFASTADETASSVNYAAFSVKQMFGCSSSVARVHCTAVSGKISRFIVTSCTRIWMWIHCCVLLQASKSSQLAEEVTDQASTIMTDLQYLMAWILHSLATQQKTRKGGGSKKKLEVQASLPIEQLLHWLYKEQMHCMETKVWRMNTSMSAITSLKYCVLHNLNTFPGQTSCI